MTEFQLHLKARDADEAKIVVRKVHIDMAGDLVAGIMLSQIVYWHLPSKQGESKLAVKRDGRRWLAKKDNEWFDEIRISSKQATRARQLLVSIGLIETKVMKFGGTPVVHIRVVEDAYLKAYNRQFDLPSDGNPFAPQAESELPHRANPLAPQGESLLTKTTDIDYAEITNNPPGLPAGADKGKPEASGSHRKLMDQWYKDFKTVHGIVPPKPEAARAAKDLKLLLTDAQFTEQEILNMLDHLFWICSYPRKNEAYFVRRGYRFATLLAHYTDFPRDAGMDIDEITAREREHSGGRQFVDVESKGVSDVA